jgi:5-formyltetrahydrofolate cyclo-ligase
MESTSGTMDLREMKKKLRQDLLAQRKAMSDDFVAHASRQIFERWRNRFSLKKVAFFHCYQTMPQRHEVDTEDFKRFVYERHPQVNIVVPIVDDVHKTLRHAHIHEDVEMRKNRWGILEPHIPVDFVHPMQVDMVIVPMLGFNERGHRLGYGAGYYDRFLALLRPSCLKIGLCYSAGNLKNTLPVEEHDIPVDFVVTEETSYRFNPNFPI